VKRTCQLNFANDRLDFDWKEAYTPRYVIGLCGNTMTVPARPIAFLRNALPEEFKSYRGVKDDRCLSGHYW
jgi:hypothetical protein